DIGAPRLLAHGMQVVRAHDRARLAITFGHRRLDPDPIGLLQRRCVRPVRLLRMARSTAGVENNGHGSSGTYLRTRDSPCKPHHCANVAVGSRATSMTSTAARCACRRIESVQ